MFKPLTTTYCIVKVVASPSNKWYLDHVDNTWEVMYAYDPADNITDSDEKAFLLGGMYFAHMIL